VSAENASPESYAGPLGLFPVPYSQRIFNFHWFNFYNAICFQIILGAPVILLAKDLGASSLVLGIIASFTPLMTVMQLPAAHYLNRCSYRSFALAGWALRSLFIITAAITPLLSFFPREIRLAMLLGSLFFFNLLRGISTTPFLPWLTSIVGSSIRGRFISVDHIFINAGSLVTMAIAALLMNGRVDPLRYSLVIWVSVLGAIVSLFYMSQIPDAQQPHQIENSSEQVSLKEMLALRPFRNWILFSLLFVMVSGGLGVFPVEYLKMQAHIGWHSHLPILGVKPSLIPDKEMEGFGIALSNLIQEEIAHILAHSWSKEEFDTVFPVYFQSLIDIAPLILGSIGGMNPDSFECPTTPDYRKQSVSMFISYP
jgi:hypothetical protein